MTPDATWMFCSRSAASTSPGVSDKCASRSGSSHTRMLYSRRPNGVHVAHAVDASQRVANLNQRVVADVELVEPLVGRDQMHDHQQVGRALERGDAQAANFFGQPRLGDGHAVLHEHLGLVEIRAQVGT